MGKQVVDAKQDNKSNITIKNIKKLKQFGIFKDHTNTNTKAKDFGKYNLFYGWNGSGKSTLSDVFRCIEKNTTSSKFPASKFTVSVNGGEITEKNVTESDLNVYTFNHDFIDENIAWNSVVQSILLVDKERIEDREKLEELKKEQVDDNKKHRHEAEAIKELEGDIEKFGTHSARRIKSSLQSIDTTDSYYLNYDKRKFEKFITNNSEEMKSNCSPLDDQKIVELTHAAKPDKKSPITFHQQKIKQETFTKSKERLADLLKTSVVSQTIQRLVAYNDINAWVETGLNIHSRHDTNQCEFCGNTITEERKKQLEAHFNDDYKAFQSRLESADDWLSGQFIQSPTLPSTSDFYDEFKEGYDKACADLKKAIAELNKAITLWHTVLKKKRDNPLETGLTIQEINESSVKAFNDAIGAIDAAIGNHNHKSGNFTEETEKAKKALELHYAATEVKAFGYHEKEKAFIHRKDGNDTLKTKISARKDEIRKLEDSLSNEGLGADQFNASLHKFLGRSELTLRFSQAKKGYEILRNGSEPVDGNLSEGEKTAIAFVYFVTKLKESNNNIEDTIVVVDDPISSFDSNHLLHAYSFMKESCKTAKQLFVFTHNFTFFKSVRDWILRKNKRDSPNIANVYVVKANNAVPRAATYANAEEVLTLYNSEYHYLFSQLYWLNNQDRLGTDDHFLAANLSRKLLESFLAFKFPKNRGNLRKLMDDANLARNNSDGVKTDKVYRFVNQYSHNDFIVTNADFIENQMSEGREVIADIFAWIQELDGNHYQEMIEVVRS